MNKTSKTQYLTYCAIDLGAIKHNLRELRKLASSNKFFLPTRPKKKKAIPTDILAVIKADAYGHGISEVAKVLDQSGVEFFGVSDLIEGINLRKSGIKKTILLFESTMPSYAKDIVNYDLTPTVCNYAMAAELNRYCLKRRRSVDIHVKVDTGMGRLGVWHKDAHNFIKKLMGLSRLRIMGILTHFPAADTDKLFTRKQIKHLYDLVISLDKKGLIIPYIHAANSMGLAGYKTHVLNLARPGLMIYGLYPHPSLRRHVHLKPAMSIKTKIIFIKEIKKGQSISYGRTFFTKKDLKVAVLPIGYNDGYFRAFSNKSSVLVANQRCPVLGRVTMDQIIVDVSKVKNARLGMPVVIMGKQGKEMISADELAEYANTISYEIVCNLGNRLPKVYR